MAEEKKKPLFKRRIITDEEIMEVIHKYGAPSTKELKRTLGVDSKSVRMACGRLMAKDKVFPMSYARAVVWLEADGKVGMPSIKNRRAAAGMPAKLGQWKAEVKAPEVDTSYDEWLTAIAHHKEESGWESYEAELKALREISKREGDSKDFRLSQETDLREQWGVGEFYREALVGRDKAVHHDTAENHKLLDESSDKVEIQW